MNAVSMGEGRSRVGELYDWLSRYTRLRNALRFGEPDGSLTMHKILRLPADESRACPAPLAPLYIDDAALAAAALPPHPRVLDAGCGFGGTVFRWHQQVGGRYDGLTLSRVQWKVARREARRRGVEAACRFHLRSYDAPIAPVYDAVVAIEALVHSSCLERTVANLAGALKPGGRLVVAEDIPPRALDAASDPDVRLLKECWNLVDVPAEEDYRLALARSGLRLVRASDHSAYVVARSPAVLKRREAVYAAIRRMLPFAGPRFVVDALRGGLALERLYRRGLMRYRILVARKHS